MAEISKERSGEMVRAAFEVLIANPEGLSPRDVIAQVAAKLILTADDRRFYESGPGQRKFDRRLRFATIGPVKAGWLVKANGIWVITPEGEAAYETFTDSGDFTRKATRLYRVRKKSQPDVISDDIDTGDGKASTLASAQVRRTAQDFPEALRRRLRCTDRAATREGSLGRDG